MNLLGDVVFVVVVQVVAFVFVGGAKDVVVVGLPFIHFHPCFWPVIHPKIALVFDCEVPDVSQSKLARVMPLFCPLQKDASGAFEISILHK